jgi:Cu-Zn family superoxide dismutase
VTVALVLALVSAALPSSYAIPGDSVFPEGVTLRPGTDTFYVSSTATGTIYRGTLDRPRLRPFLAQGGNGRIMANGLRASRDHLVVAGSLTRRIFVYDLPRGGFVRRFEIATDGLVNDVAFAPNGDVYATESTNGVLYRIPAAALKKRTSATRTLRPFVRLGDTPIGPYSNGLVAAGDRYLLVVGTSTGVLGRVDLQTKRVRTVDVPVSDLAGGDGLARSARTLYAVNAASRIAQIRLSRNWLRGTVVRQIASRSFHFPTTVQIAGPRLLVVNSQLDNRGGTPELPFTVSAVRRP